MCEKCMGTGSLSKSLYGQLDCAFCDAADERTALNEFLTTHGLHRTDDQIAAWEGYQYAKRQEKA